MIGSSSSHVPRANLFLSTHPCPAESTFRPAPPYLRDAVMSMTADRHQDLNASSRALPSGRQNRPWPWLVVAAGCLLALSPILLAVSLGDRIGPPVKVQAAEMIPCCPGR